VAVKPPAGPPQPVQVEQPLPKSEERREEPSLITAPAPSQSLSALSSIQHAKKKRRRKKKRRH
ncbi:MAG: hypothetical protein N2381_11345, partial [Armatimonadetes bacterium]|nr:hypothetical protein [Armatimonadota bacterium]